MTTATQTRHSTIPEDVCHADAKRHAVASISASHSMALADFVERAFTEGYSAEDVADMLKGALKEINRI